MRSTSWIVGCLVMTVGGAGIRAEEEKVLSKQTEEGLLIATRKIQVRRGLFLTVALVVLDPPSLTNQRRGGLTGNVSIENLITVKDHQLEKEDRLELLRDDKSLALVPSEYRDLSDVLKSRDAPLRNGSALYRFLNIKKRTSLLIGEREYVLDARGQQQLDDFVEAVRVERVRLDYEK